MTSIILFVVTDKESKAFQADCYTKSAADKLLAGDCLDEHGNFKKPDNVVLLSVRAKTPILAYGVVHLDFRKKDNILCTP